ncbi:hypothetical protein FGE12_25535 [Aggregicoccus sp. 17bor-14]|uniref:hypothetical protein n=1 Tax=Myxococcaceae TaxID=31 RepID=UPI00129CF9C7|nr:MULTISPECIES: hypothetical protein [Myxococcaceae]MBF5045796.1 hypothetical protein [Simulacricoccus sp. 17bor-14]MRI91531.1 hypothetical protein [Aggregicoccus sp. 17bor-14]
MPQPDDVSTDLNTAPTSSPPATGRPPLKERFKLMLEEYGPLLLGVYLGLAALVFVGAALALRFGLHVEGTAGTAGTLAGAWVILKLTQLVRIPVALALTPLLARLLRRKPRSARAP